MAQTIFSKIISGDIPAHKVYEDEHTLAFLDIAPIARGHTLVIHKKDHAANLSELAPQASAQLIQAAQKTIALLKDSLGASGVNLLLAEGEVAGQEIAHAHIHLVPRYEEDGLRIHKSSDDVQEMSSEELARVAKEIVS